MKKPIIFYGTGGAEAIPNAFCGCDVCEGARREGGRELRRRSMLRVGEELCIDFGPDAAEAARQFGSFAGLERLLVTHTHEDHFHHGMLEMLGLARSGREQPLHVYFTGEAFQLVDQLRENSAFMGGRIRRLEERGGVAFHRLRFGEAVPVGDVTVLPLRGNHTGNLGERPANYLLTLPGGATLLYAVDTGYFLPETLEALRGRKLSALVTECTHGSATDRGPRPDFHLDFAACLALLRELAAQGTVDGDTRVYLTHINHRTSHRELCGLAEAARLPFPLTVAWDGLTIEL